MKKTYALIALSLISLTMAIIASAAAVQVLDDKVPVIIGFKGSSDAALVESLGGEIKYQYNAIPAIAARVPEHAISSLKNDAGVEYVEMEAEVHIFEDGPLILWNEDDDYETPWGVDRIDAEKVHSTFTGKGVKVAVIDTGVDYFHPELKANYHGGYDFVNSDTNPMDDDGHGTHVAGIIAAVDNDVWFRGMVVGVAPDAELYALKVLDSDGNGWVSDINAAIDWAIENDMDVISMSLGRSTDFTSMRRLCQEAYDSGIVIVAAAGNGDGNYVSYPAAYDSVIAVTAIEQNDSIACFSNIGPEIELAAPGGSILSTYMGNQYATLSGTSMATPHVSGVVALLLSADSGLEPAEVRELLAATATDLGEEGKDNYYGYGLVNASAALENR